MASAIAGRDHPYLHQDLLNWHYKRSKVSELWLPIRKFLLFPCGLLNTSCLFLLIIIAACSFVSLPFSIHLFCKHHVFCIHALLSFSSNSETVFYGLLVIGKKKSSSSNPVWKVVRMTWFSASSTSSSSLLNRVTYCLSDSPSAC